jgi:hypothetical protein
MWTGIRSLLVIAAVLYLASWWALMIQDRLPESAPRVDKVPQGPLNFRAQKPQPTA